MIMFLRLMPREKIEGVKPLLDAMLMATKVSGQYV